MVNMTHKLYPIASSILETDKAVLSALQQLFDLDLHTRHTISKQPAAPDLTIFVLHLEFMSHV